MTNPSGRSRQRLSEAPTKAEFHARVWSKLLEHQRRSGLLRRGDRVLVGVSGGADSVCLADFLHRLAPRLGLRLRLVHAHHGLRGRGADADARFVEDLGARLGLPVTVLRLPVAKTALRERRSLEDAGRRLRYRALLSCARKARFNAVAVGHHSDDQAETLLLHLMRGTRARGLEGMPARRELGPGVSLLRPLLPLTRADVLSYLRYRGLKWREDPTNRRLRFTRNWVRWKLLPLLETRAPGIRARLAAIAEELATGTRS